MNINEPTAIGNNAWLGMNMIIMDKLLYKNYSLLDTNDEYVQLFTVSSGCSGQDLNRSRQANLRASRASFSLMTSTLSTMCV